MGKRLICPICRASADYDVPGNEAMASQREVKCRPCGNRFVYGFAPEYVTEADREPQDARAPAVYDSAAEAVVARDQLARHVMKNPQYADRDRDVLLLHLLDCADHFDEELSAIKRVLDVLAKRAPSR